jgi:hypothetical protein
MRGKTAFNLSSPSSIKLRRCRLVQGLQQFVDKALPLFAGELLATDCEIGDVVWHGHS